MGSRDYSCPDPMFSLPLVESPTLNKVHLVLVIHSHQPVGNFDAILERIYQQSYLPFLQHLSKHPGVRMGLHYSGPLLEWLDANHPEFMEELGKLAARR